MRRGILAAVLFVMFVPSGAQAQDECVKSIVFTLPGVTWEDIDRERPPELLHALDDGSAASLAVRTNEPETDYASGFLTIGAGSRANAGPGAGGPGAGVGGSSTGTGPGGGDETTGSRGPKPVKVGGFDEILERADEAGYGAAPGSLASTLEIPVVPIGSSDPGMEVPTPLGPGRYALLAAMDESGVADAAFTEEVLAEDPSAPFGVRSNPARLVEGVQTRFEEHGCAVAIVDPGDLTRADMASAIAGEELREVRAEALDAADDLLGRLRDLLGPKDLLIVVTPTSPRWEEQTHLGVAVAVGPTFEPGATLRSASTNRAGIVTLPDIAPTLLEHHGAPRPAEMLGRRWIDTESPFDDRIEGFARFDREAVFMHYTSPAISTGYVIFQVILYAAAIALLWSREDNPRQLRRSLTLLEIGALTVVAFPLATYLTTPLQAHELGAPLLVGAILAIDVMLVLAVWLVFESALDRLFACVAATFAVVVVDQFLGGPLQLNAVWGIDPITAGRFAGLGNISFAILGTTGLLTGALLIRKRPTRTWAFAAAAGVFILTIVVDGAPSLGSDVGGVLALVPALGLSFILLTGRRPSGRAIAIVIAGALVVVGAFLALDLSRSVGSRTHLARLFEDVRDRGIGAFNDVIFRKARANLRLFRRTIWTYLVPVALGLLAYLVLRPKGSWSHLAAREPKLRAALIGGMLVAILGFAVNDSGIVVPAMALSYLVPLALVFHLTEGPDAS